MIYTGLLMNHRVFSQILISIVLQERLVKVATFGVRASDETFCPSTVRLTL